MEISEKDKDLVLKIREARIELIIEELSHGWNSNRICKEHMAEWCMSRNQCMDLIRQAIAVMADEDSDYIDNLKIINVKRLEELYVDCVDVSDVKNALRAIDLINKTASVYTQKIDLSGDTQLQFTFDFAKEKDDNEQQQD